METFQHDDTMDLATSPYRQADDLDIDLDPIGEPSIEPHSEDTMFDDNYEAQPRHVEVMEEETIELGNDDEMMDDESVTQAPAHDIGESTTEAFPHDQEHLGEDDDILYEEEEITEEVIGAGERDQEETVHDTLDNSGQQPLVNSKDAEQNILLAQSQDETDPQIDSSANEKSADAEEHRLEPEDDIAIPENTNERSQASSALQIPADAPHGIESSADLDSHITHGHSLSANPVGNEEDDSEDRNRDKLLHEESSFDPETINQIEPSTGIENMRTVVEDAHLHPVKVIYQDSEICLFPPTQDDDSDTFFLSDASLAFENLDRLLAACREVLAGTIGDDDELVLDVASLGLHICEDSKYATQMTLSQILDVYLALSHNENVADIEPLYCTLTSRVCLASQYAYLSSCVQEGKTFTEISLEHLGSPNDSAIASEDEDDQHASEPPQLDDVVAGQANTGDGGATDPAPLNKQPDDQEVTDDQERNPVLETDLQAENVDDGFSRTGYEIRADLDHSLEQKTLEIPLFEEEELALGSGLDLHQKEELETNEEEPLHHGSATETQPRDETNEALAHSNDPVDNLEQNSDPATGDVPSPQSENTEHFFDEESVHGDSNSSHTVEAGEDFSQSLEVPEGLKLDAIENPVQDETENIIDDHDPTDLNIEEFFNEAESTDIREQDDHDENHANQTVDEDDFLDLELDHQDPVEHHDTSLEVADKVDQEDLFDEDDAVAGSGPTTENGLSTNSHSVSEVKTPSTPAKGKSVKRKVPDDEDDLVLLDLGTPDMKRRRPS